MGQGSEAACYVYIVIKWPCEIMCDSLCEWILFAFVFTVFDSWAEHVLSKVCAMVFPWSSYLYSKDSVYRTDGHRRHERDVWVPGQPVSISSDDLLKLLCSFKVFMHSVVSFKKLRYYLDQESPTSWKYVDNRIPATSLLRCISRFAVSVCFLFLQELYKIWPPVMDHVRCNNYRSVSRYEVRTADYLQAAAVHHLHVLDHWHHWPAHVYYLEFLSENAPVPSHTFIKKLTKTHVIR